MSNHDIVLDDDKRTAQGTLRELLEDTDTSIMVVLNGDDLSSGARDVAVGFCKDKRFKCKCVWAKDPSFIEDQIIALTNSQIINWSALGSRVVSINVNDKVTLALSRNESDSALYVLGAFWAAVGGQ